MTNIPGAKAKHALITDECRDNRGDLGAFEEACRRLKLEYDLITRMRHPEKGLNFHLVLTVEDTKQERKPLPEREEGRFNTVDARQKAAIDEVKRGKKSSDDVKINLEPSADEETGEVLFREKKSSDDEDYRCAGEIT